MEDLCVTKRKSLSYEIMLVLDIFCRLEDDSFDEKGENQIRLCEWCDIFD